MENLGPDIFGKSEATQSQPADSLVNMANPSVIKVVGVGGGGGNAIKRMIKAGLTGVEFWEMNTDVQVLALSNVPNSNKVQLGAKLTNGLGAGGNSRIGEQAAEEATQEITAALEGADMVFIAAGMGGGTGTGAAPVVAKIAKDLGILTIAVVTKPFSFEGNRRMVSANEGLEKLREAVDSLLVIPNDKLLQVVDRRTGMKDAFVVVDEVILRGVQGISDIITKPGEINVDFADVKSVMENSGSAVMGIGIGSGEGRAVEAAQAAVNSNLLETSIHGASGLIVNVTGGPDMTLFEITDAINLIRDSVLEDANIIIGTSINEDMQGEVSITVVATGFELKPQVQQLTAPAENISPSIDTIFSGLNSNVNMNTQTTAAPTQQAPANNNGTSNNMPPFTGVSFTNIEIPDFLKK